MYLNQFLLLAAFLFSVGVYGVLARKNGVLVLMSIELILNAVNINLVALAPSTTPSPGRSSPCSSSPLLRRRSEWGWPSCCSSTATATRSTSPKSI